MITIEKVRKTYGDNMALKEVNIEMKQGSCFGLVGPNGAGKSTLMKILASIIQPDGGKISIENERMTSDHRKQMGYIPQEICLEQQVTAEQNLRFFGQLYGLKGKALQKRTEEVLCEIGLDKNGKEKVDTFSGGMKRRLNIGCAFMHRPRIIMMDEPTVGIDPQSRRYIFQMIESLKADGCTIIYASHYMEEVERLCDEMAFIDHGQVIDQGKMSSLMDRYAEAAVFVKGDKFNPTQLTDLPPFAKRNEGYQFTTNNALQIMEKIINHCQENEISLERLELVKPSLEDVFFELTGNHLRD